MKIEDIKITPINHAQFNKPYYDLTRIDRDRILEMNNTLTDYIAHQTGVNTDWGAEYANFLQGVGIEHQTENGWWSMAAVKPENITYFIKVQQADNCEAEYEQAAEVYNRIKHGFTCQLGLIETVVKMLCHLQAVSPSKTAEQ